VVNRIIFILYIKALLNNYGGLKISANIYGLLPGCLLCSIAQPLR